MKEKPWKYHAMPAVFSCILAAVMTFYYYITQYGTVSIGRAGILRIFIIAAGLFLLLEAGQLLCARVLGPMLSKGKTRTVYLLLYAVSLAASLAVFAGGSLFYQRTLTVSARRILGALAGSVLLFLVLCLEIRLWKRIAESPEKGFRFTARDLTISVFCTILLFLSFVPAVTDHYADTFPYSASKQTFLNVADRAGERSFFRQITDQVEVSQTFVCEADNIHTITLFCATYARKNSSKLRIRLINEDDSEVLETWTVNTAKLKDNSYFDIQVPNPRKHKGLTGKKCRLEITSPDGSEGNAVTLYYATVDRYPDGALTVNGEDKGGDLIIRISGAVKPDHYDLVRILLCVCYALFAHIMAGFAYRRFLKKRPAEMGRTQ